MMKTLTCTCLLLVLIPSAADAASSRAEIDELVREISRFEPEQGEAGELELVREHRWTVQFEPSIWVPALRGEIGVRGGAKFDVEAINLDESESSPMGQFTIRAGDLSINFNGFAFGINETENARTGISLGGTNVAAGTPVSFDLSYTSVELTVGYRLWGVPVGVNNPDPERRTSDLDIWFDGFVGFRSYDVDLDFDAPGVASDNLQHFHAIAGFTLNMDLPQDMGFVLSLDAGGGVGGGFS